MDTHPWILDQLGKDEAGKASDTGIGCHHSQHSHISHQTGFPTARPQPGLRSQFIYPNLSRFIPIYPNFPTLQQHLDRSSLSLAWPFSSRSFSQPHSRRRSAAGASASGSAMNKGARDFWERPWHGSGSAGIRGFGGHRSSCLPPSGDGFFPPPQLPDLGNDSGDRNPG